MKFEDKIRGEKGTGVSLLWGIYVAINIEMAAIKLKSSEMGENRSPI